MTIDGAPDLGKDMDFHPPKPAEENVETEITSRKQIWMIEDSAVIADTCLGVASDCFLDNNVNAEVIHFREGETAIAKFRQLACEDGELPVIILMDYRLDQGVKAPKYSTGVQVIEELQDIAAEYKVQLPEIVAFSSSKSYAQELLDAGATSSVLKDEAYGYFKNFRI